MSRPVDFTSVSEEGLEGSAHAAALAGLRANEARYFANHYGHRFTVDAAKDAPEVVEWVEELLRAERNLVIGAVPLEVSHFVVSDIDWSYVFYDVGLVVNVLYTLATGGKRAVGFKLADGAPVPAALAEGFRFARQRSRLAGTIRGSFFVIRNSYEPLSLGRAH